MTQEERELILKDICARLPYRVKIQAPYEDGSGYFDETVWEVNNDEPFHVNGWGIEYEYVKPYLFPLSSMTEEERIAIGNEFAYGQPHKAMDLLHKRHIDYRGLIEKGLAIDATGLDIY